VSFIFRVKVFWKLSNLIQALYRAIDTALVVRVQVLEPPLARIHERPGYDALDELSAVDVPANPEL
jgi:hypothetical protein